MKPKTHEAYRGYLIQKNPFTGIWYVSKDGFPISQASSLETAKVTVDAVLGPQS